MERVVRLERESPKAAEKRLLLAFRAKRELVVPKTREIDPENEFILTSRKVRVLIPKMEEGNEPVSLLFDRSILAKLSITEPRLSGSEP